jgi:putative membrane protein
MTLDGKRSVIGVCCAALFSAPVLLQGAAISKTDADFMNMAAKINMTEAHLGQMAEAQAAEKAVKDFGQKLSQDHTTAYEGLTVLANKTGESIPKAISKDKTMDQLMRLKGNSFDHAFLMDEVGSHKAALTAFQNEAEHGENADVKAWAQSMIPTLKEHLQEAENLAKPAKKGK